MTLSLAPLEPDVTAIFMHIEHTGGTTLWDVLHREYTPSEIFMFNIDAGRTIIQYAALPETERKRYRLIIGHLSYGVHRHVPGKSRYLTILRHPVERILSSYSYIQRTGSAKFRDAYQSFDVSWQEHFDNRGDHRRQIGRITGGTDAQINTRRNNVPVGDSETAIAHLENDFAMIGLQERYDESLLMMRHVLKWRKPPLYVRKNFSLSRIKLSDLPAADRALIEKMAETEMPLYEYAQKRFAAQIEAYPGDLARDLAQFRADNARYAQSQARIDRLKAPVRALRRTLSKILKRGAEN